MRPIVAALYILLLGPARPTYAAEPPSEAAKQAHENRLKIELRELQGYLAESHKGKRGDDERYVILHRMLQDYGMLKSTGTPEAQAAIQEWHELLKSHPEFKTHAPKLEIREQREISERQEKAAAAARARSELWVPKDNAGTVYGLGIHALIQFDYRVEFFNLPENLRISGSGDLQRVAQAAEAGRIRSKKVMTFKHIVDTGYLPPKPFDHPIWLCENLAATYGPRDKEEMAVIPNGKRWVNASGEFDGFCGAVSLEGNIVYKLPISEHYPDQLLRVLQVSSDGKKASIGLGQKIIEDQDGIDTIGKYRQVLVWEFPDKLEKIDTSDRASAKAALEKQGLSPWVLGR